MTAYAAYFFMVSGRGLSAYKRFTVAPVFGGGPAVNRFYSEAVDLRFVVASVLSMITFYAYLSFGTFL